MVGEKGEVVGMTLLSFLHGYPDGDLHISDLRTTAGITEANGMWKIGNGGMTEWARRTMRDYSGDIVFDTEVTKIRQTHGIESVQLHTKDGRKLGAKDVVSTKPL